MAATTDGAAAAPFVGVVAALALLGAATSTWLERTVPRAVGDVAVTATESTPGTDLSSLTLVAAVAGLACSIGLLLARGGARRVVALLLVVTGVWAVASVGVGLARVRGLDGVTTLAPWLALLGAAGILAAGLLAFGRPGRRLPARYDVDAPPEDAEWSIASGAPDPAAPEAGRYAERRPGDAANGETVRGE